MAIQDILNKLSSELFMKNMRQHIVDGLEQVYKDATAKGDTNMEVLRARGSSDSLNGRLDGMDLQQIQANTELSQKASINYVDAILMDIAKGGPKGLFNSLTSLVSTHPNGAEGTFLVIDSNLTDGAHSFIWNDASYSWKDLGVYQSMFVPDNSIGTNQMATKSVSLDKLAYLDIRRTNIYNDATSILENRLNETTGGLVPLTGYKVSDFIEVKPNTKYYISETHIMAFYDSNKQFVIGQSGGWSDSYPNKIYLVPNNSKISYLRLTVKDDTASTAIVSKSDVPVDYVPYTSYDVKITNEELKNEIADVVGEKGVAFKKNSLELDILTPFSINRINLANPDEFSATDTAISNTNGSIITATNYQASGYIPIKPNTQYMTSGQGNLAYYDSDKDFLMGVSGNVSNPITTPNSAFYVRVTFGPYPGDKWVVEGTSFPSSFIPYDYTELRLTSAYWKEAFQKALEIISNRLSGVIWNVLGDSITFGANANGKPYHVWIKERNGMIVKNYGISMSTVSDMIDNAFGTPPEEYNAMSLRYADMGDADVITVMAGTNDIGHGAPLGVMGDEGTHTFYGALDTLIKGLINKYPTKSIGYILPPYASANSDGGRQELFIKAIKEVCKYYSIPVLDLYTSNQLGGRVPARASVFIPDGLHPSEYGHEKLSYPIEQFLLTLI